MKITQEQQKEGQEFYQNLIARAWEDVKFKNELVKNPKEVIENFADVKMDYPKNVAVIVEDQSDSSKIYLNIPRKVNPEDFELTDEQLETAAGGEVFLACVGIGLAIGGIYVACKHTME